MATVTINGAELYYEEQGSGEPLLLIHGNGANVRIWGQTIEDLASSYRVIAYDRRGFDRSSGPLAKQLSQHADDAAGLLGALGAEPAVVVGWSAGGVVALDLAARYPTAVASLVLAEAALHLSRNLTVSSLKMTASVEFQRRIRRDRRRAAETMERWAMGYTTGGSARDRFSPEWKESMIGHADAVMAEIDQLARLYPKRDAVAAISCPVTLLEGSISDRTFQKANKEIRELLPGAEFIEIEGASHAIHFDRPDEFAAAVRAATLTALPTG